MELGTYRLAEINKGGGLRQKAVGEATQYLNGIGQWVEMPTSMTPTAHNHTASEITSGTLELAQLPRIAAGSIYVGAGTSNDILTLAKGSALQALRTNASGTALEWYTTQWKDGQYGTGSIKTNSATATGLRSGDGAKPYVYWSALAGQDLKAGGLAGTDQKWMLISPSTVATYAYGGVEYTYNNTTANYVFLLLIDNADFIGSDTNPFNICRIIANAGTNYLYNYRAILTVGTPITGNVYPVIVTTGSSTAPSGINYTESVSLYAPLKSSSADYSGNSSVASGNSSIASGSTSVASGYFSVASGYFSVASGNNSVASGERTIAGGSNQTVIGKWNLANTTDAFIIGNGSNEALRSNCMTVDFSGNMTLAGSVKIPQHAGLNRLAYFDSAGKLQSDAEYTLSSFALEDHTHSYLPTAGGTVSGELKVGTSRQFIVNRIGAAGRVFIQGNPAGWSFTYGALGSEGTDLGGFGFYGNADTLYRYYIGIYSSDEKISILSNGNVGIGNTSPSTKLDVNGTVTASSFSGVGSSITSLNASNLSSGTVPIARLPVGTGSTQVSAGDHTHAYSPTSHASSANTYGLATASLYGHAMASSATPLVAGTASAGTDNGLFAREGHVHPVQTSVSGSSGSCTGNAATATKLATARTISLTGSVTGSGSFDGSGDVSITTTTNHTHSGYAASNHNHDSTYLKLSGGNVTGKITLDSNGGIYKSGWEGNRIAYFVSGDLTTSSEYTTSSFATASHSHSIPELQCGVANIVPGRILISGSGGSSNPTWMAEGANGKILGWTSGAPAWVDAPSGSSVSPANPTASVGLAAVNGSAATFMRSDAAPKLDVTIAPTWTGNHTFSGLTKLANVGIGVDPSTSYKLYVVEDKKITTAGSYIGSYLIAKYNTDLSSGTRQGIALLGQLWATGGTLTHAKGLDFKIYVPSGTVQEAIAINAVIQTDGGSIGTAYALKLSRSGTAPTVKNYGIYQDDSAATNVFNGYCEFNGGTNIPTGRVRNFLNLSAGTTLTPDAGTDLLVFFETSSSTTQTLILPTTSMAGRAGDIIRVVLCGNCKLTFSTGSGNNLIKPAYYGATLNYLLTTENTTGEWVFVCDGTNWRSYMLSPLYS